MTEPIVSVIIPAYNCENTIVKCLDSVINQKVANMEVIVVNDGSKDCTEKCLNTYAEQYSNIKVISQENKGPSAARNRGLLEAAGTYIMFIDCDDELEEESLPVILEMMESGQYDLLIATMKRRFRNKNGEVETMLQTWPFMDYGSNEEIWNHMMELLGKGIANSPAGRLYRRSLIENYQIRMDEKLHVGEDLQFNLSYLEYANSLKLIPDILYIYNTQNSFLTNSYRKDLFAERSHSLELLRNHLTNHNLDTNIVYYLYIKLFFAQDMQEIEYKKSFKSRKNMMRTMQKMPQVLEAVENYKAEGLTAYLMLLVLKSKSILLADLFSRIFSIVRRYFSEKITRVSA